MKFNFFLFSIFFVAVNSFPQRNSNIRQQAAPRPSIYQNCRFGPVWGLFRKTCITPGTKLNANKNKEEKG